MDMEAPGGGSRNDRFRVAQEAYRIAVHLGRILRALMKKKKISDKRSIFFKNAL
jgi:hypothetical protein